MSPDPDPVPIRRRHLASSSPVQTGKKLTILRCPPGYGKSVLMRQWHDNAGEAGFEAIYCKLRNKLNSAHALITHLLKSLGDHADGRKPENAPQAFERLLAQVQGREGRTIIFLDNLECLSDREAAAVLDEFIDESGAMVQFVASDSGRCRIHLSPYRAKGELEELTCADLRYTSDELAQIFDNRLNDRECQHLLRRTEGWPIAIRYAAENKEFLENCLGEDALVLSREMSEFIDEQIIDLFPNSVLNILVSTCMFTTFSAEQASMIANVPNAKRLLDESCLSPLLTCDPYRPNPYSMSLIFRSCLWLMLQHRGDAEILEVYARASHWFESAGDMLEAILAASKGGDTGRMISLFKKAGGVEIGVREGVNRLEKIVELFPIHVREREPVLLLSWALIYMKKGNLLLGYRFLEQANSLAGQNGREASEEHSYFIVRMLMAVYDDEKLELEEIEKFAEKTANLTTRHFWDQGFYNNLLCMMYYSVGEMEKARNTAEIALEFYRISDASYSQIFAHLNLAFLCHISGNLSRSRCEIETANAICGDNLSPGSELALLVKIAHAEICLEAGDMAGAQTLLDEALPKLDQQEPWVEVLARAYLAASHLAFNRQGLQGALNILARGQEIARARHLPRLANVLEFQALDLLVYAEELDLAALSINRLNLRQRFRTFALNDFREDYRAVLSYVSFLVVSGAEDAAIKLLDPVIAVQERREHRSFWIRAKILKTKALVQSDRIDEADTNFISLINYKGVYAFVNTFLSESKWIKKYINEFLNRTGAKQLREDQLSFLGRVLSSKRNAGYGDEEITNIFSPRELQTLQLLGSGHSNKVIAREMGVTEVTTKYHLRNIFSKLGVKNRHMAIEVARLKNFI